MAKRTTLIAIALAGVVALAAAGWLLWSGQRGIAAGPASAPDGPVPASAALDPQRVAAVLEAARQYVSDREFARAEAVLRAAVAEQPSDHRLREALGEVLLQQDEREAALEQYAWLVENGSESAPVAFVAGSLAAVLDDPARASAYHERAQSLDPSNADYPLHLARAQVALGRVGEAKVSLTRAAVLDEGRGPVWGMLAELALRENRLDVAAEHVAKARRLEPGVVAWRVLEARVLKRRGEPERALMLLQSLSGPDRWNEPVLATMGECLGMLGRGEDALSLYEVAIENRPEIPAFPFEAALWAERLGRTERAVELATRARMMGEARAQAVLDRLGG